MVHHYIIFHPVTNLPPQHVFSIVVNTACAYSHSVVYVLCLLDVCALLCFAYAWPCAFVLVLISFLPLSCQWIVPQLCAPVLLSTCNYFFLYPPVCVFYCQLVLCISKPYNNRLCVFNVTCLSFAPCWRQWLWFLFYFCSHTIIVCHSPIKCIHHLEHR